MADCDYAPDFSSPRIAILGGGPGGYEAAIAAARWAPRSPSSNARGRRLRGADRRRAVQDPDRDGGPDDPRRRGRRARRQVRPRRRRLLPDDARGPQAHQRPPAAAGPAAVRRTSRSLDRGRRPILVQGERPLDSPHHRSSRPPTAPTIHRGGRHPAGRRRQPARAAHRPPGRRAHPQLGADLQHGRTPRGPDRRRFRCHRRRVRLRLQRPRLQGHPDFQPRPRAARVRTPTPPRSSRASSNAAASRCCPAPAPRRWSATGTASSSPSATAPRSTGSHCLVAVGSIPNTAGIGLEEAGVALTESGHIKVDGVSRTTAPNIYAAGDCTGVLALASVAAMQGRIAVCHFLGDSVTPLEAAPVGVQHLHLARDRERGCSEAEIETGKYQATSYKLSLRSNARAKDAHHGRLRQDLRPQGLRHRDRRRGGGAERLRADLRDLPRDPATARRRRRRAPSRCTPR